jgi:hypothetical protein
VEGWAWTYSADDVVMVGEMRLALAATVDTVRVEVDVVGETHDEEFVDAKRGEGGRWHRRRGSEDGGVESLVADVEATSKQANRPSGGGPNRDR